jgi:hypothetical protein
MKTTIVHKASVAWAAAAAVIVAAAAYAYPIHVISSFRVSGTSPPYARGLMGISHGGDWYCIKYVADGYNYLYKYDTNGSLLSTVHLPGAVKLGDAEIAPPGFSPYNYFGVLDNGAHDVKVYDYAGSFVGTWRAVSTDTVGYGRLGYSQYYTYLGTRDGRITVYSGAGSFINSYATGIELADLAAEDSYAGMPGDFLVLGPARVGDPNRVYRGPTGSLQGTFSLPGTINLGASSHPRAYYYCLRLIGSDIWAYQTNIGGYMAVEPASLGKVKALFR